MSLTMSVWKFDVFTDILMNGHAGHREVDTVAANSALVTSLNSLN